MGEKDEEPKDIAILLHHLQAPVQLMLSATLVRGCMGIWIWDWWYCVRGEHKAPDMEVCYPSG
jgi:hypothetical protein